ncbi:hypothetical protein ElyMa_004302900 [Elysia marginata]|uniref:Uncharacterized protein n=1 Tax=Elysia marginata TaxID=1093978 RepID=A0AAV4GY22_9GAST|nr:hypothetical protein ElyMa_004302900 [Elysia marginata]
MEKNKTTGHDDDDGDDDDDEDAITDDIEMMIVIPTGGGCHWPLFAAALVGYDFLNTVKMKIVIKGHHRQKKGLVVLTLVGFFLMQDA